jgi:hypothetical protein
MSTPTLVFKFSRAGKVFLENVTLAEAVKLVAIKTIMQTDHYWTDGMADWKLVSSRAWENPPEAAKPPTPVPLPAPVPVVTPPPVQPKPAPDATPAAAKPLVIEKGFSPYATYYRSKDDLWAYGIFGGLAHRNCWSSAQLEWVRFLTLIFIFPAIAYLLGWGLMVMFLTPPLPTTGVRSYYDVGSTPSSNTSSVLKTVGKVILWIIGIVFVLNIISFLFRLVFKS